MDQPDKPASPGVLLIAEDDPDDQVLIRAAIRSCSTGAVVRFVDNGEDLIHYLRHDGEDRQQPRLILLDLNMPRKDGRQALREIKADPNLAHIPIVVLTTSNLPEDRYYCLELGAHDYYDKPNPMTELESVLCQLLGEYMGPRG